MEMAVLKLGCPSHELGEPALPFFVRRLEAFKDALLSLLGLPAVEHWLVWISDLFANCTSQQETVSAPPQLYKETLDWISLGPD
jgi:hypothetical protein